MPCFLLKTSEFDELVAHYIRVGSKTAFHFIDGVCHYIIPVLDVYKRQGFSLGTEIKKLNLNVSASYNNNKSADESRSQSEEYLPNGSQYAYNLSLIHI